MGPSHVVTGRDYLGDMNQSRSSRSGRRGSRGRLVEALVTITTVVGVLILGWWWRPLLVVALCAGVTWYVVATRDGSHVKMTH